MSVRQREWYLAFSEHRHRENCPVSRLSVEPQLSVVADLLRRDFFVAVLSCLDRWFGSLVIDMRDPRPESGGLQNLVRLVERMGAQFVGHDYSVCWTTGPDVLVWGVRMTWAVIQAPSSP